MTKNNNSKTKLIQAEILKIYAEIKRVCEKHNIRYYAVGGTELGAVRHHGFIPWDDDMDLGIPIDDFEKFKKACKKDLPPQFEFLESYWMGGKVHNKNTTFLEAQGIFNEKNYHGVFVDIFIIIGSPNDLASRQTFLDDMRVFRSKAFTLEHYPESSGFTPKEILNWKYHITHDFPYDDSETLVMFSTGHYFFIDPNGLKNPISMPFENTTMPVSSNYKKNLREHYGNYKKLPPEDQRRTHDEYAIIDLNTPCKEYYKKIQQIDPSILPILLAKHKMEGFLQDDSYNKEIMLEKYTQQTQREKKNPHPIRTLLSKAKHFYTLKK